MTKKMISLMLTLLLTPTLMCHLAGAVGVEVAHEESIASLVPSNQFASQEEAAAYYLTQANHDAFGGFYYDEDGSLVVNVVGELPNKATYSQNNQTIDLQYRKVSYSIRDLEAVKDFLTLHMDEYPIMVLDANEVMNQVEVGLELYTEETMTQIQALVDCEFPDMDCLHFEDYSNCFISTTVGHMPSAQTPSIDLAALPPSTETTLLPGMEIKIGDHYYTLGPFSSARQAYSAGHEVANYALVTTDAFLSPAHLPGIDVGRASPRFGGATGDWSSISAGLNIVFSEDFKTTAIPPVVGKPVLMLGAVSKRKTGTITGTNVSLRVNGTILTEMCAGDYLCAQGDSGAGIYDSRQNPLRCHYGVQSSGLLNTNGEWAGTSYFTPLVDKG